MSDVKFDLNYMLTVQKNFNETRSDIDASFDDFVKAVQKTESESIVFVNDGKRNSDEVLKYIHQINDRICLVQDKRRNALSQKEDEIPVPSPPKVPSDASPEAKAKIAIKYNEIVAMINKKNEKIRENNRKIDKYVDKCDKTIKGLDHFIIRLNKLNDLIRKTISTANNQVKEFLSVKNSFINDGKAICSTTCEFSCAFTETLDVATRISLLEPLKYSSQSMIDRQFVVKNNHIRNSGGFSFDFSRLNSSKNELKKEKVQKIINEEVLVKERDEETFLDTITNVVKFKMPSSNLHRLGGKKFISKMQSLGYELIVFEDGSTIDNSGMLHWERKI